jgi:protein involved in polysaccharide export with SLBB domain
MIKLSKTSAVLVGFALAAVGMSLWAQQPEESRARRQSRPRTQRPLQPPPKATGETRVRPAYVVEPPDLIIVEVLEALPGRPISGERLVRPDGSISLGYYGDIRVAGLSIAEIKEKVVLHLRKFITDETLGLVEINYETGERKTDPKTNKIKEIPPRETDRVFVDVTSYNSAASYVEGDVLLPGRIPYTGGDTVLDLIHHAGGLLPIADRAKIRLVRNFPKGSPTQILPVDYEELTMGTDSSTNYLILPNDRLVVPHDPYYKMDKASAIKLSSEFGLKGAQARLDKDSSDDRDSEKSIYFGRKPSPPRQVEPPTELEQRVSEIETKLDKLIELMEGDKGKPRSQGNTAPAADPAKSETFEPPAGRDPLQGDEEKPERKLRSLPHPVSPERDPFQVERAKADVRPGVIPEIPTERDPFAQDSRTDHKSASPSLPPAAEARKAAMEPPAVDAAEPDSVRSSERRARVPSHDRDPVRRREALRPVPGRTPMPRARRTMPRKAPRGPQAPREAVRPSPGAPPSENQPPEP